MNNKTCETCRLYSKEHGGCVRTKTLSQPTDSCSHWIDELPVCDVCGQYFIPPITVYYESADATPLLICPNCAVNRGHCKTCVSGGYCDFQENHTVTEPPMIQQTARQGNMIMTKTVPNPARIELTCKKNCKCYNAEFNLCSRGNFDTCGNYDMKRKMI